MGKDDLPLRADGDLDAAAALYNRLGLPRMCAEIKKASKAKFDLDGILRTLVTGRLLFPCSKQRTLRKAQGLVRPPKFGEADMYRALSLLSGHIDDIQAGRLRLLGQFMERRDRVIYYDCTNYYFEIEDNDRDTVDLETGEHVAGCASAASRRRTGPAPSCRWACSWTWTASRWPSWSSGNESEQATLQPLEDVLRRKFGLTEFVVSTDAGLASEGNRATTWTRAATTSASVDPLAARRRPPPPSTPGAGGWATAPTGKKARLLREKYSDGRPLQPGLAARGRPG